LKRLAASLSVLGFLLLGGTCTIQAQNALAVNPGAVFLYALTGGGPAQQSFTLTSSPVATVPFSASASSNAPWLTFAPSSGSSPATIVATGNPSGLASGVYSSFIGFSSPNASPIGELAVLTVNDSIGLSSSPANLIFSYTAGSPSSPAAQTLTISSTIALSGFTAAPVNAPWMLLGQSGSTVTVIVNPNSLTPGQTYVGGVRITPSNGQSALVVPVVLFYFTTPQLSASPTALTFNYQIGATNNNVQKTIAVSPSGATFTATANVTAGSQQWLSVSPTSGMGTSTVTVLPAGLPAGTYQGSINLSASGSNPISVPVTLNVSASPLLDLSAGTLSFTYQVGSPNPAPQTITPSSTTPGMSYTVAATSQGNWLSVNVNNAVTPSPVTVTANPAGLAAGTYTGSLSFNAVGAGNNPQTVNVTLTVTNNPTLTATPSTLVFNYEIGQSQPAVQTVSLSSVGPALSFTITGNGAANGINWLLLGQPTTSTTPASFTVAVSPTGLTPGVYNGTISLSAPGAAAPLNIPVTLNVSNTALLNLPTSLSFSTAPIQLGQPGPTQTVTVTSTGEALSYTVTASTSTPPGSNWLAVGAVSNAASNSTPSTFVVVANPPNLGPGVYQGSLLVHPANGNPDTTIPVTLTIVSGNLSVSPASLSFTQVAGGSAPVAQTINVTGTGGPLTFAAFATLTSAGNWLSVSPTAGVTPATLSVSVNGAGLQPGTYNGVINITSAAAGNSPQTVAVSLTIGQPQTLALTPGTLTFSSQAGAGAPQGQTVGVTVSNGTLPFTTIATTNTGGNWLSVTPSSGTATQTATNLTISVNPAGLTAGTYTGNVSVAAQGAGNSPQTVNVTYTVTAIPTPVPGRVQNAGDSTIGPIAPGEILSIFGTNLGPATPATTTVSSNGFFATTLSDTQVFFDNIPAAMWYASATQINAIVPYEIAGRASTLMQVVYKGTPSASVNLQVASTAPGIFVSQNGQAAVINQNGSINGPSSPAQKNTAIVIYATGEGATTPAGVTGFVIPADPNQLKHPIAPVSVTIGGQPATVQYAGSAPGLVSGAFQVNVVVPDGAPSGNAVEVVLTVGSNSSQGRATIAIQ
jgi:uncharacterized protein (TIGR03437 family)